VAEGVVADIVGHEKDTITYGLYSGGTTMAVKRLALDKLTYPTAAAATEPTEAMVETAG
jgi:hypothetical protein